jgi:GTP:adenosylcobinamide-phosphate guanylyltransferase
MERYAYILAGGKSSRFGSNKALVQLEGQPHLLRLADALQSDGWSVTVVARTIDSYADLTLRVIADHAPDQGPVAGLLAALRDLQLRASAHDRSEVSMPYALCVPCDLWSWNPRWTTGFLDVASPDVVSPDVVSPDAVWKNGDENYPKGVRLKIASAIATNDMHQGDGFIPFPCWLHADLHGVVQEAWDAGERSLRKVFARFEPQVAWVPIRGNDDAMIPRSFNTIEELRRLHPS